MATEIGKDLPELTVHDISHLDALWEVASQITGSGYTLTPAEGYVLGGAILLHDLAMSLAATPGGYESLKTDQRWRDLVVAAHSDQKLAPPSEGEVASPTDSIRRSVVFSLLRQLHAENAEKLAFLSFQRNSATPQYLIEDTELRQTFGRVIGQVAHSHWWSVGEVERNFDKTIGAPHWAPPTWTINPMKIACILRAADAAHVDARRAPTFQKAFATIGDASRPHWTFQERINKAYLRDDALVYTSGLSFSLDEANAWWLCLDTLRMIDKELRQIDSLLADRRVPRFAARRVAGVDAPERLATYIQTVDWHPINATIQISDLPNIIRSLGGEELYGTKPRIPLRELIQNSSDAIRARRSLEGRANDFGDIKVTLTTDGESHWLRVEDNGIGMSQRVLTDFLLDFGNSFWTKPQVQEEFPGLLSSGFRATGRYGIGFFSVFMAADRVTVLTRRPDAAAKDTLVLEFGSGLTGRPILRPASKAEQLRDGGTVVSLQLKIPPSDKGGLLFIWDDCPHLTLLQACQRIAPALDSRMTVIAQDEIRIACEPNDWIDVSGAELLGRLERFDEHRKLDEEEIKRDCELAAKNLRLMLAEDGNVVGRACVTAGGLRSYRLRGLNLGGAVTVGGFAASPLQGIAGVILGESTRAARDQARPTVSEATLAAWATEQASLVGALYSDAESLSSAAEVIRLCGGKTGDLPIAIYASRWLSAVEIATLTLQDEVIIVDHFVRDTELKHKPDFVADPNVFFSSASGQPVIFQSTYGSYEYGSAYPTITSLPRNLSGAVIEAVASAWKVEPSLLASRHDFDKSEDVRIGVDAQGQEIRTRALIVRRTEI